MFRRRRHDDAGDRDPGRADIREEAGSADDAEFGYGAEFEDSAEPEDDAEFEEDAAGDEPGGPGAGPWDGAESYPEAERMDFGSLLVPAREGLDVQVNIAEDQGVWIAIVRGESALQLQAFAAPKTSGLWDEVRREIADEVAKSGGESREAHGPFGPELHARIAPADAGPRRQPLQQVRFMGVDGPRWFLRGVISGPAANRAELARPFEELFADVVVVRGDHPAPPRDLLEIRLPEDARRALEEQMAQAAEGQDYPNPFDRGPEITETR